MHYQEGFYTVSSEQRRLAPITKPNFITLIDIKYTMYTTNPIILLPDITPLPLFSIPQLHQLPPVSRLFSYYIYRHLYLRYRNNTLFKSYLAFSIFIFPGNNARQHTFVNHIRLGRKINAISVHFHHNISRVFTVDLLRIPFNSCSIADITSIFPPSSS